MPHDKNGRELKVGDIVLVPCKIKAIHMTEQYCNTDLETMLPGFPREMLAREFTLNSRQTIRKGRELELLRASRVFLVWLSKNNPGASGFPLKQQLMELIPVVDEALGEQG